MEQLLRLTRARGSLVKGVTECPQHSVRICARNSASEQLVAQQAVAACQHHEAAGGPSAVRVSRAGAECVPTADAGALQQSGNRRVQ